MEKLNLIQQHNNINLLSLLQNFTKEQKYYKEMFLHDFSIICINFIICYILNLNKLQQNEIATPTYLTTMRFSIIKIRKFIYSSISFKYRNGNICRIIDIIRHFYPATCYKCNRMVTHIRNKDLYYINENELEDNFKMKEKRMALTSIMSQRSLSAIFEQSLSVYGQQLLSPGAIRPVWKRLYK